MIETTRREGAWSVGLQRTRGDVNRLEHIDIKIRPSFGCSRTCGPVFGGRGWLFWARRVFRWILGSNFTAVQKKSLSKC
jgi:hypothetical protein